VKDFLQLSNSVRKDVVCCIYVIYFDYDDISRNTFYVGQTKNKLKSGKSKNFFLLQAFKQK
jgi:hypothetical protein